MYDSSNIVEVKYEMCMGHAHVLQKATVVSTLSVQFEAGTILDDCALTYKHIKLGMPALCCFDWLDHVGSERVTLQLLITTCIVTQQQVIATALSGHNLLMQAVSSNQDHLAGSVASSLQCKECICSVPMKQMTLTFV